MINQPIQIVVIALVLFSQFKCIIAAPPPPYNTDTAIRLGLETHRGLPSTISGNFPSHLTTLNGALLHQQQPALASFHQPQQPTQQQSPHPTVQQQPQQLQHLQLQQQQLHHQNNHQNLGNYTWAMHETLLDLRQQWLTNDLRSDEHFRNLMSNSKRSLHNMFTDTYGITYEQNTEIFTSMFESLEQYYANGQINLNEAMKAFFERLYQKIFQVFNNHLTFLPSYLECATDQLARLKPFKDVPDKLIDEITHSFIAARTLNQALNGGLDVITSVISLGQSPQCIKLINEKLLKNNLMANQQASTPCLSFCESVIGRCIGRSNLDLLNRRWADYVLTLNELAKKLSTSYNIETIIAPLDVQISEAIMNFQENAQNISQHVFHACGDARSDLHSLSLHNQQQQQSHQQQQQQQQPPTLASMINGKPINQHVNRLGKRAVANYTTNSPSALVVEEVRKYILSTAYFFSSYPNSVCTSILGTKKQTNCFTEPLGLADANTDMRYRVEINQRSLSLENMRRKIEVALKGREMDWASNTDDLDDKGHAMTATATGSSGIAPAPGDSSSRFHHNQQQQHASVSTPTTSIPSSASSLDTINGGSSNDDSNDDTDGDDDELHEPGSGESEFDSTTEGGLDSEENVDDFEGTESGIEDGDDSDDDDVGTNDPSSSNNNNNSDNNSPTESSTQPNIDNNNLDGSNGLTPLTNEDISSNQITNSLNQPDAQKSGESSNKLVITFENRLIALVIPSIATWYHFQINQILRPRY